MKSPRFHLNKDASKRELLRMIKPRMFSIRTTGFSWRHNLRSEKMLGN